MPKIEILTLFLLATLSMDALMTFPEPHEFHREKEFHPMPIQRKPEVFMYSHVEKTNKQRNTTEEKHNVTSNSLVKPFQSNLTQNGDVNN